MKYYDVVKEKKDGNHVTLWDKDIKIYTQGDELVLCGNIFNQENWDRQFAHATSGFKVIKYAVKLHKEERVYPISEKLTAFTFHVRAEHVGAFLNMVNDFNKEKQ